MDEQSSNQSLPSHHHRQHPFLHITLPGLQSPKHVSPPAADLLEYGGGEKEFTSSFGTTGSSPDVRRLSGACERAVLSPMDGVGALGGHLDQEVGLGEHFSDSWYSAVKKEGDAWENGRGFTSPGDDFYGNRFGYGSASDAFPAHGDGTRCKAKGAGGVYSQCGVEAQDETAYEKEARTLAGSISDSSLDYCRTDSRVSDNYLSREEDYGSSCGSGEDPFQPAEPEAPWLHGSPSAQVGEGRWQVDASASERHQPQRSPACGTYPQKLDSFSDAFLRQSKKMFPVISSADCSGLGWDFGPSAAESPGSATSRHSCAFDSDSYLPTISSSSSPAHPSSLASFPSPPTPSHLVSSVLSPPPTPRPLPSYSPSKTDSPGIFRGAGHSVVQGGEAISALQFFTPHLQPLPPIHTSGMIWKLPLLTHGYTRQPSANLGSMKSHLRAPQNVLKSKEPSFLTTRLPPNSHGPSSSPSVNVSAHLPPVQSPHFEQVDKTSPYMLICRGQNGTPESKHTQLETYTGSPFPSILHSGRGKKRSHYTPRPLLNPVRTGEGLYSSVRLPLHNEAEGARAEEEDEGSVLPRVNLGPDFQAELPKCFANEPQMCPPAEFCSEQLLWKPADELKDSASFREKVEKLLFMCSSSCLPGGGSNTELALHCLHLCNGDTVATLEKLLFSQPLPTGDYHYSGSDFWTESEKSLFSAALEMHGKEFSLIQKMVRTKTVPQCVEYYYLSKKLHDKQEKEKEEGRQECDLEQQARATPTYRTTNRPFALEEVVLAPPLTSFFPCKLCGKMFYKIKSRNAHMKIHRQPQDDWADRRLQHQLFAHRLSSNALRCVNDPAPQSPAGGLPSPCLLGVTNNGGVSGVASSSFTSSNNLTTNGVASPGSLIAFSNGAATKGQTMANPDDGHSSQREPGSGLPFRQPWASIGQGPDPVALFCNHEEKDNVATVGLTEPINW